LNKINISAHVSYCGRQTNNNFTLFSTTTRVYVDGDILNHEFTIMLISGSSDLRLLLFSLSLLLVVDFILEETCSCYYIFFFNHSSKPINIPYNNKSCVLCVLLLLFFSMFFFVISLLAAKKKVFSLSGKYFI
jgi:hypothetical protein